MTVHGYSQSDPASVWPAMPHRFPVPAVPVPRGGTENHADPDAIQFAAYACCRCGAGLARYPLAEKRWTCHAVIKRTAVGEHTVRLNAEPDWSEPTQVPFIGYRRPRGASVDWTSVSLSMMPTTIAAERTLTASIEKMYLEDKARILAGWDGP